MMMTGRYTNTFVFFNHYAIISPCADRSMIRQRTFQTLPRSGWQANEVRAFVLARYCVPGRGNRKVPRLTLTPARVRSG